MDYLKFVQAAGKLEQAAAQRRRMLSESLEHQVEEALARDDRSSACVLIEDFLKRQPGAGNWWHELALLRHARGDPDGALSAWRQALATTPGEAALLHAIGRGIAAAGHHPAAVAESAWGTPDAPGTGRRAPALEVLGEARWAVLDDDWPKALPFLVRAMRAQPADPQTSRNLAHALEQLGLPGQAQCVQAVHLLASGDPESALLAFDAAPPADTTSDLFLADYLRTLRFLGKEDRAVQAARSVPARVVPPLARTEWAHALVDLGREHEAITVLHEGSELLSAPGLAIQAETLLPSVPSSQAAMDEAHQRVRRNLLALQSRTLPSEAATLDSLARSLRPNFLLAYMGDACVEEAQAYARHAERVMAARFPQFASPPPVRRRSPDDPVRIGCATSFANHHVVMKSFAGWLQRPDRGSFEIHVFPLATERSEVTGYLESLVDVFHPLTDDPEAAASQIRGAGLDLLVYPEIGMDPLTFQLAAMRLAAVQAVAGGHPMTTGLSTIDYYLSAAAAEPPDAVVHYCEQLVTLPGMGICMPPVSPPAHGKTRADFGLADDHVAYLSTQNLFKYQPVHDDLYARIAASVDNSVFLFVEGMFPAWDRIFCARLRRCFASRGLDLDRFVRFMPHQDYQDFLSLNAACDILLDPPGGFSGGMTTRDALACGLPVITLPGPLMRSRQSFGLLSELDILDTVATDPDDYVRLAVELGKDGERRAALSQLITERRDRLFDDDRSVEGLSAFFRWATGTAQEADQSLFEVVSA